MSLRVVQSTWAKFHHFDLARQLHRRGLLEAIFTTYPKWKLRGEQVPLSQIRSNPWLHTLLLGKWKFGWQHPRFDRQLLRAMVRQHTAWVARTLPPCDVFIALSGSGLAAGRRAQSRGARYICDRGSSHIRFGDELMKEEFARWGGCAPGTDPEHIALEEQEYAEADCITVPSEFARRSFLERGVPAEKLRRIPYGVDLSRFEKCGEPARDEFNVLFVGQVSFRKGVPYLLDAFSRLRHPRKHLTIVGAMQPEMKRFLAGRHFDHVTFTGPLPQPQLPRLMSTSHVKVLPSIEEGLACVQGQALACGCPLISSAHTGGEDLFTHGREGFIVPIRDPQAIADRLEELAQAPALRDRMSEAALERVRTLGGWDAYGSAFENLCRELGFTGETAATVKPPAYAPA